MILFNLLQNMQPWPKFKKWILGVLSNLVMLLLSLEHHQRKDLCKYIIQNMKYPDILYEESFNGIFRPNIPSVLFEIVNIGRF